MVAIVDYGVGNLFSLCSSFAAIGEEAVVTRDQAVIASASHILLPGVGAFRDAREKLRQSGLEKTLLEQAHSGKPLLGVCLGMQLLFEESMEFGRHRGLSLIRGRVIGMQGTLPSELLIPHIGWNALKKCASHPLLDGIEDGDCVYFVHSFYASDCEQALLATAEYGLDLPAAVACGNVCGCQFHPEKSGEVGLRILKNFCKLGDRI